MKGVDCDLWLRDLGARLDRQREESGGAEGAADAPIRRAAVRLLDHITRERGRHFRRAPARWHGWETEGFLEGMSEVLEEPRAPV